MISLYTYYIFDPVRLVFPCKFCLYCICHSVTEQIVPIVQNELSVVKQMTECETAVLKKRIINKSSRCLFTFSINNLFSTRFLLAIFNVYFFSQNESMKTQPNCWGRRIKTPTGNTHYDNRHPSATVLFDLLPEKHSSEQLAIGSGRLVRYQANLDICFRKLNYLIKQKYIAHCPLKNAFEQENLYTTSNTFSGNVEYQALHSGPPKRCIQNETQQINKEGR